MNVHEKVAFFWQAPIGMALTGLGGEWLLVNKKLCEMLGYSEPELRSKTLQEVTDANDWAEVVDGQQQLLAGEISSHSMEKRYVRKDGSVFWARLSLSLVRDDAGSPLYFIAAVEDISNKLQAERMLHESQQQLTLAQKAAHMGGWNWDLRRNELTTFGEFAALYGLSTDDLLRTREEWLGLIHPDDRSRVQKTLKEVGEQRIDWDIECRVCWPDGSTHWLCGKGGVYSNEFGQPIGSAGICFDITERKQAESALRESEERFRNMADAAPVMIWVVRPDKICTFVNKPCLDFTGRSMEQQLGVGWAGDVHPRDRDRCLDTYNSSFDARCSFQMEYRLRRADGEYRWVLNNGTPLYRGSEFAGFIGSCIDITEQKLIEEQLRASAVQFKDAQRLAQVGSWERYLGDDTIHRSEEMLRILGLPNDAPESFESFINCVHTKDREKVLEASRKVRLTSSPVVVEYRIIRPEGEVRFVRSILEAIRNDLGEPVRLAGATQDITEQVKARYLLRQSEERLKNAERLAHLGHWHWDLKLNQLMWSEETFRIFGQSQDHIPSYEGFLEAVIPQDRERVKRAVANCLNECSGFSMEFQIARPKGSLRTLTCITEVSSDEELAPAHVFGTFQDNTDLRRAQQETLERQKLESIGTLASGIAHDFNNLLGGVLVQAELALGELAAGSNPEEGLKAIHDLALRGSEIVRELMIYAGKETAVVGHIDVSLIVKEMLQLLKVSVSKHAIMEADLGKDLPAVRANAAQLRQIVMNLVTNASDALGDRDGVIRVTTKCMRPGPGSPGWIPGRLAESDYVQIEVSDTGCGMPREIQTKVFDPFFTTKSAGRGLGLAIVDRIARDLGGAIHVTSESGKGSTFQVLLPGAETTATTRDTMSGFEQLPYPAQHATILVVEDEGPIRQAVTKMLRKAGFEVFEVADGSSAIDLLRVNGGKIDLILLDMTIPGASSAEVVAEAARVRPDVRAILTSAYSQEMIKGTVSAPQVHSFIRKPFQLGDLVKTIENVLAGG